jgi:O-acetyl-ADP-ribose deacetylase (regulator of RNase III)
MRTPSCAATSPTAGDLSARWVIHTVGPTWATTKDKSPLRRSCYATSLAVADELAAATIAFPLVSAGIYHWPKDDAVRQALTVLTSAETRTSEATMVLFDEATLAVAQRIGEEFRLS